MDENPVESSEISQNSEIIELITQDDAMRVAVSFGVVESEIYFMDLVPYDRSGNQNFEIAWVFLTNSGKGNKGTFIDAFTGELIAYQILLPDNLMQSLQEMSVNSTQKVLSAVNQYESYPWGYDLPTNFGNHYLTQGYGVNTHVNGCCSYNQNYYAVDLSMSLNECVPAPGSGWCMFAGDRGDGYGKQVIILAGSAGGSSRYVYRLAHLNYISVVPGWWISKNRSVGGAGTTGNSTGVHLHFSIHRGYYSSGNIYGGSVPLDRWPASSDRVDYFDRYAKWQFSFNVCR